MKLKKQISAVWNYCTGNYKACEFALTNICIAKCSFCGIWKQKEKIIVDKDKALQAIDKLADIGVRFLTLTGGEPLMHPNIAAFVKKCTQRGIVTAVLDADPRLITDKKAEELRKAGLDYMCISIDHYTNEIEYESRKIENMLEHIREAILKLKKAKIKSMASILICNFNHTELEKLFEKCNEFGFDLIAINYPEHSLSPVYELGGKMVVLTKEQTIKALQDAIRLKKKGYKIINPIESMQNIIKYLSNEKADYLCFGGNKVLFVDWFFDVHPCMHLNMNLGKIFDFDKKKLLNVKCNKCNMSWYRDFSIYFNGLKSVKPLIGNIKYI